MLGRGFARMELGNAGLDVLDDAVGAVGGENAQPERTVGFDGNVEKLKPICDIQLGCDYNFKDDLSFYAEVKNLIHNKYQIYYGYPSYGFQMFLGFKYRF